MKKPYIITKLNPIAELEYLDAKSRIDNPLGFLEIIKINDKWASDAPAFDLSPTLEFILIDDTLIERIIKALTDYGFNIVVNEVTEELLLGKIDLTEASFDVKEEINNFYLNFFDNDDILDKICSLGMESLTELDKSILNKKP
jgi:hypothetical protein